MKFYLPARSENFDFFGIVDVNEQYKKWLFKVRGRFIALHAEEEELAYLTFWDSTIDWYERGEGVSAEDEVKLEGLLKDDCEVTRLPDDFAMDEVSQPARTECDRLIVEQRGFYWRCYPKHCDYSVQSDLIEWKDLDANDEGTTTCTVRDETE